MSKQLMSTIFDNFSCNLMCRLISRWRFEIIFSIPQFHFLYSFWQCLHIDYEAIPSRIYEVSLETFEESNEKFMFLTTGINLKLCQSKIVPLGAYFCTCFRPYAHTPFAIELQTFYIHPVRLWGLKYDSNNFIDIIKAGHFFDSNSMSLITKPFGFARDK